MLQKHIPPLFPAELRFGMGGGIVSGYYHCSSIFQHSPHPLLNADFGKGSCYCRSVFPHPLLNSALAWGCGDVLEHIPATFPTPCPRPNESFWSQEWSDDNRTCHCHLVPEAEMEGDGGNCSPISEGAAPNFGGVASLSSPSLAMAVSWVLTPEAFWGTEPKILLDVCKGLQPKFCNRKQPPGGFLSPWNIYTNGDSQFWHQYPMIHTSLSFFKKSENEEKVQTSQTSSQWRVQASVSMGWNNICSNQTLLHVEKLVEWGTNVGGGMMTGELGYWQWI